MANRQDWTALRYRFNEEQPVTARLGIAAGSGQLTAVLVIRGRVAWHGAAALGSVDSFHEAVEHLMSGVPARTARARVEIGLSPAWVAIKQLHGLPTLRTARLATQIVRENPRSFFLMRAPRITVPEVYYRADGDAWGAAFETEALHELTRALRTRRLRVARIAPSLVHLAYMSREGSLRWADGDLAHELDVDGFGVKRLRRVAADCAGQSMNHSMLATVDGASDSHLAALAAALAPKATPLAWMPPRDPGQARALQLARRGATALAFSLAIASALVAPGIRAQAFIKAGQSELAKQQNAQRVLETSELELRRVTETLNRVEAFRATRGAISGLLSALSVATPDSTALLSFRVDSAEGVFTAVAPHVSEILPAIAEVKGLSAPKIAGAVTRELVGGVRLERATFRFVVGQSKSVAAPAVRGGTR